MNFETIYKPISKELLKVEMEIKRQILTLDNNQKIVKEAINYFFNNKGKYLRPALVLLSGKIVNGRDKLINDKLISLSSAVEMIHNASLIHDDIIDDDESRREVLSLNKKFGNHMAMMIGDMLYTRAFLLLANNCNEKTLRIVANCVEKMCYGEIKEITKDNLNLMEYLEIIKCKTASFMSACCEAGAIISGGDEEIVKSMRNYGLNFGIAYQLRDDYLDKETPLNKRIVIKKMDKHIKLAKKNLAMIENNEIKESLNNLLEYFQVDS
ncbi:MAG: polyprenyl synthetase family protein [Candidatus Firestonebacteria bacterium]